MAETRRRVTLNSRDRCSECLGDFVVRKDGTILPGRPAMGKAELPAREPADV